MSKTLTFKAKVLSKTSRKFAFTFELLSHFEIPKHFEDVFIQCFRGTIGTIDPKRAT